MCCSSVPSRESRTQRVDNQWTMRRASNTKPAPILLGVLDGGDFGKDAHGPFRGVVGRGANGNDARNGGDVDNRPATSLTHGGDGILGAEKDSGAIDRHDLVPHLSSGLFNGEA